MIEFEIVLKSYAPLLASKFGTMLFLVSICGPRWDTEAKCYSETLIMKYPSPTLPYGILIDLQVQVYNDDNGYIQDVL